MTHKEENVIRTLKSYGWVQMSNTVTHFGWAKIGYRRRFELPGTNIRVTINSKDVCFYKVENKVARGHIRYKISEYANILGRIITIKLEESL